MQCNFNVISQYIVRFCFFVISLSASTNRFSRCTGNRYTGYKYFILSINIISHRFAGYFYNESLKHFCNKSEIISCKYMTIIWCYGSSDRSFMMDQLLCFSFQLVLHDWCNKGRGMCYHVCGMMHIKELLLLIRKNNPCCGSGFPLSLSEWSFTICLTP